METDTMTDDNSTTDSKFTDENGDLGDFESDTSLGTPEPEQPDAEMPERDAPDAPNEPEQSGGNEDVTVEMEKEMNSDGGVEWVRIRMNAQRGNGPDQRGDATFEAAGSDPEKVLTTVKDGFKSAMTDLEDSLGLGEESE